MKTRPHTALVSALALSAGLTQCVLPPIPDPAYGTGYSLDSGPASRRSRQGTRYLESTQPPPIPTSPGETQVSGPAYETPESIDTTPPAGAGATAGTQSTAETQPSEPTPPAPTSKPSTPEQLPFGVPVPGKKGFVYSPFDKTQMVDVRGIPPGKKVRCPYTSKIFLVP